MKKIITIIIAVALTGMIGWSVYEFVGPEDNPQVDESGGVTITSPPSDNGSESDETAPVEGSMAPDFELETIDGEKTKLSDHQGETLLVNFWATWCPPCRKEIPDLQKLYDNKDVEILAVNMTDTEESESQVKDFVKEYDMTFPVLMDKESDVGMTYQIPAYPTTYIIDEEGRIQFVAMGAMDYEQMEKYLEEIE